MYGQNVEFTELVIWLRGKVPDNAILRVSPVLPAALLSCYSRPLNWVPGIAEHIIVPCLRIISQACTPPKPDAVDRELGIGKSASAAQLKDENNSNTSGSLTAVTQSLKLPSVVLRASCAANLLTHYAFPSLRKEGYLPVQDSALLDLAPGLHPFRFNDLPAHSFNLDALLWFMVTVRDTGSSSAIIWITMDCLEQSSLAQIQKQCQIPLFPIGPMHKIVPASSTSLQEEETSCIRWLDRQSENAVIYISLGCIAIIDANELAEMAWGLANSKQPFLWFVRPGSIRGSNWIELLHEGFREAIGERGCIVKWAPQKEVLAHAAVGGFWSHCGWNSTPESICEGSPMICRPYFGDQRVITRYASHLWRVGLNWRTSWRKER
ncbi:hypothetical protein GH714_031758 [Hevea brasiliensis]|uniref:UDP-glucose iridoid glucosyltransferase-like n=1 Tax=Hevea brasiliensis TaxID=3981 RepID=A0A6A6LH00_HEVBR|nr:hypothetical protein GH714_031758 [Hevea brasiliensis]